MIGYAFVLLLILGLSQAVGCHGRPPEKQVDLAEELKHLSAASASVTKVGEAVPREIALFCGDCHALPRPDSFPREVWYEEIEKGFGLYARSGRTDLVPPPLELVLQYYHERAPLEIVFPEPPPIDDDWRSRFDQIPVEGDEDSLSPAISSLQWVNLHPEEMACLIACDMRDGSISLIKTDQPQPTRRLIGRVGNPARAKPCDLNHDGRTDFIVADLGSFNPADHEFGQVVWLKRDALSEDYENIALVQNLGRVADISIGELSGDGASDLLIAEFGHRSTGSIQLLINESGAGELPRFTSQTIDSRPGTIQIPIHDWDGDGRIDFAAIVSQEFECIDLFLNRGTKFDRLRVATGSDLTFGSVGMELADLDGDGDQDILYVNGDCFDNNFANLSHGVQWLENLGELEFRFHRLADMPGAYRVVPADMDNDGDLDLLAIANLPTEVHPASLSTQEPACIILLEQQMPRQFVTHVLQRGSARYAALEAADFNGDGKIDFATGTLLFDTDPSGSPASRLPVVMLWFQKL